MIPTLYYIFDNTFEGLLTAVFDAFNRKENPERIIAEGIDIPLFTETFTVITDEEKPQRILTALKQKISPSALNMLFICFLSESEPVNKRIFNYIAKALVAPISIEMNFGDEDVLELSKTYKKVQGEYTRMKQFVRFQKTADGMYFAVIEPLFDVIPLCSDFFKDRYADQVWVLYDIRRNYGIYYDKQTVEIVKFDTIPEFLKSGKIREDKLDETEIEFRNLWKNYLKSVTIQERKNLKLQKQHMPVRFWKYLTEKQ